MIDPKLFLEELLNNDVNFFTGVPDSLLKDFSNIIPNENHIIAANEGGAIALAAGSYLATGKTPLVYMQNSGLGNAINPLMSLADSSVYAIPMIVMVGWRGEPKQYDEPQHIKQGIITEDLLKSLQLPYFILENTIQNIQKFINQVLSAAESTPVVVLVRKNTFEKYNLDTQLSEGITQLQAIETIVSHICKDSLVVSTTGYVSRILNEINPEHNRKFLMVGSMGHASQIALGISHHKKDQIVICLDGDGSVLMHMGSLATVGANSKNKYLHILFNNSCHASVGGQPTTNTSVDFCAIAAACGYNTTVSTNNINGIINFINSDLSFPAFLEIKLSNKVPEFLSRPTSNLIEYKNIFMHNIK